MKGYIKLGRDILDHAIWHSSDRMLRIHLHFLLRAAHADHAITFNGIRYNVKVGQVIFSRRKEIEKMNIPIRNKKDYVTDGEVKQYIKLFIKHDFGTYDTTRERSIFTYNQIIENERIRIENQKAATRSATHQIAHEQPTNNPQYKKGYKNSKEEEEKGLSLSEKFGIPNEPITEPEGARDFDYNFESIEDVPRNRPLVVDKNEDPLWLRGVTSNLVQYLNKLSNKTFGPTTATQGVVLKCIQDWSIEEMERSARNYWNEMSDSPKFQNKIKPSLVWGEKIEDYLQLEVKPVASVHPSHQKFTIDDY